MIKLIVFDMAGTVINENNVVYKTLRKAINWQGFNFTLEEVLLYGAGKEKHQAIKDILNSKNPNYTLNGVSQTIFNDFSELLKLNYENLAIEAFPKTEEVFEKLKKNGFKIVLNTGYNREMAMLLLNKLNWVEGVQYDALITASDVEKGRPAADMIFKAMELFNITNAEDVVKIGDSIIDIEEGKTANCGITIGVTTGAHTEEQLKSANPTYIINSLIELTQILF
ncbi:MAG: HAD family hydrolase [Bacteroidetes bacterium HGW-Bacteroidetes-18]|nr:MAG: HAD family hydrolase [Bacteroidetes bacterium HGW-Bacteroidetes-18]